MGRVTVQKTFVYLAVLFGILMMVLTPPFQSPDEDSHFKKAYVMAEGQFFPSVEEGYEGFYLSEKIPLYIAEKAENMGKLEKKFSYLEVMEDEKASVEYNDKEFHSFSTAASNPVGHVVPAIGVLLGKGVARIAGREPSIVFLLYFARMANLCLYVGCVAASIYLTPGFKRTFCMIGLMPMSLFMAVSPSYDVLLIAMGFLFAALTLRLMNGEVWTNKYGIVYGIIAFIFCALKIVYIPIFLLLLVAIAGKNNVKETIKKIGIIAAVFLVLLVGTWLPGAFAATAKTVQDPAISLQAAFVMQNPVEYLHIFFRTMKESRDYYVSSTIGYLGLVDTQMYSIFIYLYLPALAVIGIADAQCTRIAVKWYHRFSVVIAVMASVFGIFLAMYIYWTSVLPGYGVGAGTIQGVQGRYFIPLLPISFLIFMSRKTEKKEKTERICSKITENGYLISVIMLVVSGIMLLLRFWV